MNNYVLNLLKGKSIDKQTYWRIDSTSATLAVMYGLPKTHKSNYPLRPIISSIGSYNHELAKYLSDIIKSNIKEKGKSFSFVKDSFDFVKKITEIKHISDHIMLSFDVDNLFTNVPVNETIEVVLNKIYKKNQQSNTSLRREEMKHLLETAVKNVPFRFMNRTFIQVDGVAMGSPLRPLLADIFMAELEKKLNRLSTNKPIVWYRYVDDIFCIFNKTQNIGYVLSSINKRYPNISFTKKTEISNSLAFLDVLITRNNNNDRYETSLHRKPTNTSLYLLYKSNQCRRYKIGLIRTLTVRILLICSTEKNRNDEIKLMQQTLTDKG